MLQDLIVNLIGGVGLILLGMRLMTDGLKMAAGQALRRLLGRWTKTPLRGLVSGFAITSLVQSSSAVAVAVIGFVNAGVIVLNQAVWLVYGSNIGTTTTAWIVAFLGLKVDVKLFAMPFIGLGMGLWLTGQGTRRAAAGEALAGFGLFFLGIEAMEFAFQGMGQGMQFERLVTTGVLGAATFTLIGFLLTFLMQSSSAAMALILTATAGGMVPLNAAAAAVIGANVGTTTTAVLASIGATPSAKRVAAAHVVFNLLTGAAALAILPGMIALILYVRRLMGMSLEPASVLALFHTTFNVLGVLLLWPITPGLVRRLAGRFRSVEEDLSRTRYLDDTVLNTPALAVNALLLEVARLGEIVRRMASLAHVCTKRPCPEMVAESAAVAVLQKKIADFAIKLSRGYVSQASSEVIPDILRTNQYFTVAADLAVNADKIQADLAVPADAGLAAEIHEMRDLAEQIIQYADPARRDFDSELLKSLVRRFEENYQELKRRLLAAGSAGKIEIEQMSRYLDLFSTLEGMVKQVAKGGQYLFSMWKARDLQTWLEEEQAEE